jgi:hypothetical protein
MDALQDDFGDSVLQNQNAKTRGFCSNGFPEPNEQKPHLKAL